MLYHKIQTMSKCKCTYVVHRRQGIQPPGSQTVHAQSVCQGFLRAYFIFLYLRACYLQSAEKNGIAEEIQVSIVIVTLGQLLSVFRYVLCDVDFTFRESFSLTHSFSVSSARPHPHAS
jgi:hypothetical protein